ncbi:hypothetical protein QE152_g14265 [Popillia japonica]|uniref:Uncharacterized protein n=1 Tax=Popillia japonica TaxID=7064 RepID=A0AAW1L786_POPJA
MSSRWCVGVFRETTNSPDLCRSYGGGFDEVDLLNEAQIRCVKPVAEASMSAAASDSMGCLCAELNHSFEDSMGCLCAELNHSFEAGVEEEDVHDKFRTFIVPSSDWIDRIGPP